MAAFRPKGSHTYRVRVTHPDGRTALRSTQRQVEAEAQDVERVVRMWEGRGPLGKSMENRPVLDAILDGRLPLAKAYDAFLTGTMAALPVADDSPRVADLVREFVALRGDSYRRQLETLLPADWRLSDLTKGAVFARLAGLAVQGPTKNRYRAAVSQFVKYLVARDLLETNFVRDIPGFGEHKPRVHLYGADAERLIAALPQPYAAVSAVALMFCAEWTAIERLRVGDVEQGRAGRFPIRTHVRGTKRQHRDRFVPLVPELRGFWRYLAPALDGKLPDALVFAGVTNQRALRTQQRIAKTLGLDPAHTLHDWRHDHTVTLLQARYSPQVAAAHLGHANVALVYKVYGRWIVSEQDYGNGHSATDSATTQRNHMKSGGVTA